MSNPMKHFGIHLDPVIHQKLKLIAAKEGRSMSAQLRIFTKDYIRKFEEKNGEIKIERKDEQK